MGRAGEFKLELLTKANDIEHGAAHDAYSDVAATIALAKLIKTRQPKLYDYCYNLRFKHAVSAHIDLLQKNRCYTSAQNFLSSRVMQRW